MKMKSRLALFDLDGTLFDTKDVNYFSYKEALVPFGVELDVEYFTTQCNGRHYREFLPSVMGSTEHIEEVHKIKKATYTNHLDKAKENSHLFEVIKSIKDTYHIAIVTTASRKNTADIINHFGHEDLFEYVVAQEDVSKVKPDPQGFFLAMDYFGIDSVNTVIFEDSSVRIQAAKATGATVLSVCQI